MLNKVPGIFFLFVASLLISNCRTSVTAVKKGSQTFPDGESQYQPYAPDGLPFVIADTPWKADMQGNHRAIVSVNTPGNVQAELLWRRPDVRPETKKIIVVDATTLTVIKNVFVKELMAEKGIIVFEPVTVPGNYYIYYLPYKYRLGWDDARYGKPWNDYLPPIYEADKDWVKALPVAVSTLPKAKVLRFETRTHFDSFTPMGAIATQKEMDSLREKFREQPLIFPEDRAFPIRLVNQLSARWIKKGPSAKFAGGALKNEYYVWQLGVWAAHEDLKNVRLTFTDFKNGSHIIRKEEITCFNQEGINWDGKPVTFTVDIPQNKVQALWCGIQIPAEAQTGLYKGKATLTGTGINPQEIEVEIEVEKGLLADKGDGDLWRHARLRWLNSTLGKDDLPLEPYQAFTMEGNQIKASEKTLRLAPSGLPAAVQINNREVLNEPIRFIVETEKEEIVFTASDLKINSVAAGLVKWSATSLQKGIQFSCEAYMEFDGYLRYNIKVATPGDMPVNNIKLVTTYSPYASEYFMGVGFKGGFRPYEHRWGWQGPYDSYWMGNAEAGLHVEFRGGTYHGPLLNDYKPAPPPVWFNNGKGSVTEAGGKGKQANVIAATGKDTLSPAGKNFEFALLITPVKPLNTAKHFSERYYHAAPAGFDKAAEEGANVANIHHAQKLNPVINYPFIVKDSLIDFVARQHAQNRKVKLYYTIRELSNYATEIFALKSLNHEIFAAGRGYGLPWHTEHLIEDYKPAWYTEMPGETSDAALVLNGFSRWINYYLEGARWMFENYQIDGIYMDDVAFDRNVMKRMRKIMAKYRPGALIDLHSNTGYSIGPANQYTDFFPFVDRLWFGESFKYNDMTPDEWFVTFSGIPFGVMSEMLQDGGNRFLGMVYGTTGRHSYTQYNPEPVWELWKSFGIEQARMVGYWDDNVPVQTHEAEVKATVFIKPDKVLISLGNFSQAEKTIQLDINWAALGMSPESVQLSTPEVKDFQKHRTYSLNEPISIKAKEGLLLILSGK